MAFLDFLIDESEIQGQRRQADEAARERFNPDDLLPQLEQAQQVATEGIADDPIRQQTINTLFNRDSTATTDVAQNLGSGRALSFLEKMNEQRTQQLGSAETQIGLQEEEAKRQGAQAEAEIRSEQNQLESQREAKIVENRMMAEAEANRRKKQLGSTIGRMAGTVAGSMFGPLGATAGGAIGGGILGGAEGATAGGVTGASVGLSRQMQNEQAQDSGATDFIGDIFEEKAKASVPNPKPEDEIVQPNIDLSLDNENVSQEDLDFMQGLFEDGQAGSFLF